MICYAVIDTNILVSALLTSHEDAATVQIVEKIFTGEIIPVFSSEILQEYYTVLHRRKFNFPQNLVGDLLTSVETLGIKVKPNPTGVTLPDIKDLPFYETITEISVDNKYLVTGNLKHFPKKPYIVTANQLLSILSKS